MGDKNKPALYSDKVRDLIQFNENDKFFFNPRTNSYVFFLKSSGKNMVLSESKLKSVLVAYTELFKDPASIEDICRLLKWPRACVEELFKSVFLINHKSLPVTPLELRDKSDDDIIEDIASYRNFKIQQELEREEWRTVIAKSLKWDKFKYHVLDPIEQYINDFSVSLPPIKIQHKQYNYSDDVLVIGCNDWQIGAHADEKFLVFGKEWNTQKALEAIKVFAEKIVQKAKARKVNKLVILWNGDINHGFEGLTAKGTVLKCDTFRSDQFDATIQGITSLVRTCATHFVSIENYVGTGNHEGWTFYPTFRLIKEIFRENSQITFNIEQKHSLFFKVKNSLFIAHHGAAVNTKWKVPKDDKGRSAYVQRLIRIAEKEHGFKDIDRIFYIKGDTHSFEAKEMGQFTFYTFGSLPCGDEYADSMALESTPCQNALLISDGLDYECWHITFSS